MFSIHPRIEMLSAKKLIGHRLRMSLTENKTMELWHGFMQRRDEIQNTVAKTLYSLQQYPPDYFTRFTPDAAFEKWAATEVSGFTFIPDGMETLNLDAGLYAVFFYKGLPSAGAEVFQYIFGTWLPASAYALDHRPHFEFLGEKYKNNDPDSEEEIWIPVKLNP